MRVDRSVELLHSLYTEHGRTAGPAAFGHMLRLADDAQHPELARQLLQQMEVLPLLALTPALALTLTLTPAPNPNPIPKPGS